MDAINKCFLESVNKKSSKRPAQNDRGFLCMKRGGVLGLFSSFFKKILVYFILFSVSSTLFDVEFDCKIVFAQ